MYSTVHSYISYTLTPDGPGAAASGSAAEAEDVAEEVVLRGHLGHATERARRRCVRPTRAPRRAGPARGGGRHRRLRRFRLLLQRCCRRLGHARRTRRPLRWRGRPWRWARWCRGHPRERRNGRRRLRGEPRGCGRGGCSCSVRCRRPLRARSTAAPSATERRARRMNQRWRGYRRCGCIG